MNIFAFSSLLNFILPFLLGIFMLCKWEGNKIRILWGCFCLITSIWGLGGYKFSTAISPKDAFLWWQIAYICVILSPPMYYHFVYIFLELHKRYHKLILVIAYALAGIFLALNFFRPDLFLGDVKFVFNRFYWHDWTRNRNLLFILFYFIFYYLLLWYASFLLLLKYKGAKGVSRTQLKYFILGSIIGWLGPEGDFLIDYGYYLYPWSNFLIIVYPVLIAYAIIRYRLMDITVAVTRAGIFLTLYTAVLGIPFYIGYKSQSWFLSTSLAAVFATIGPVVYRIMQKKADDILLAQQRHYQEILLQAAEGMGRVHNLDKLAKLIVYIVKKTVKINFAALLLEDKENEAYPLKAVRSDKTFSEQITFSSGHCFIEHLRKAEEPLLFEELPEDVRNALKLPLAVGLVVPSFIEKNLIAVLILGEKQNKAHYSHDDINVFNILSHQAALSIENCIFLAEFERNQARIFESEKLASIGGMAEGLAHQIKNRLNQFSVASGELKNEIEDMLKKNPQFLASDDSKKSFDYLTKIADSLISNVKRSDAVIKGILNFAQVEAKETFFSVFSMREVIDLSLELLKIKHKLSDFPLQEEFNASDTVYGVKAQLMESVYNILDNAYEAVQDKKNSLSQEKKTGFTPRITLKLEHTTATARLTISDNGIGIKEEDKKKIFAPFFTTKSSYKSGTGIGIYVVKRIVEENHKGRIWFESEYGKGTTFYIELPLSK